VHHHEKPVTTKNICYAKS